MKYLIIIILIAIIGSIYYFYKKNVKEKENKLPKVYSQDNTSDNEISIKVEQLPIEKVKNYEKMTEIKDKKILARIDSLIPGFIQVGTTTNNAIQANSGVLYQAIIPKGATLSDSNNMKNAVRGFYHGENGIKGHADFVEVNQAENATLNTVSTGIGVASMIVGQYYMTQINDELAKINDEVSKISIFQNNEYNGKVMALLVQTKRIAFFQSEIMESEGLRKSDIDKLNLLEQTCIELLGQANSQITGFTKNEKIDYKEYDEKLPEIHKWYIYQKMLLEILYKITELKGILYLGQISKEQLNIVLETYTKQVINTHEILMLWHRKIAENLGIDTETARRKRKGLDGVVHWIPGLFNDDFNFSSISEETRTMIEEQSSNYKFIPQYNNEELFNKDVKVISQNGKIYYLP